MKTIGLLSDTHGRADTAEDAVHLLLDQGVEMLIHLGDVGSTGVIDALAAASPLTGQQIEAHMVLGNCDYDAKTLSRYAADLGVVVHEPYGELDIDGRRLAFTHGHLPAVVRHILDTAPDYLLHGHTHCLADENHGSTRVINPGALFRASRHTAAVLEPATGSLRVLEIASVAR